MVKEKDLDKEKQRKVMRKSTSIIMVGIFIIGFLTVLVVKQSPSIKERYSAVPATADSLLKDLVALKQAESGEYLPLAAALASGDKLAFKISVLRPTFVGLLVSVNQQKPAFVFYTRLPPGENRLIERQGNRFSYMVGNEVKTLRFCAVYAPDKAELQKINDQLRLIWAKLPESSCVALSV